MRVWSGAKGWGVPEGLDNSRGRQEKASGCLAVDFLRCGWGGGGAAETHGAFTASGT